MNVVRNDILIAQIDVQEKRRPDCRLDPPHPMCAVLRLGGIRKQGDLAVGTTFGSRLTIRLAVVLTVLALVMTPFAGIRNAHAETWLDVPEYHQAYGLSCEFASLYMVTQYWGDPIYENTSINMTSWSDNPHLGFRGYIDGAWGNTDDYGVYAEPLADIAWRAGYGADINYDADPNLLAAYIDDGVPVIVWISVYGNWGWQQVDDYGNEYRLVPYEHVVVANGYDDNGVWISDPGTGAYNQLSWSYFLYAWGLMDGMMLAVYPHW